MFSRLHGLSFSTLRSIHMRQVSRQIIPLIGLEMWTLQSTQNVFFKFDYILRLLISTIWFVWMISFGITKYIWNCIQTSNAANLPIRNHCYICRSNRTAFRVRHEVGSVSQSANVPKLSFHRSSLRLCSQVRRSNAHIDDFCVLSVYWLLPPHIM